MENTFATVASIGWTNERQTPRKERNDINPTDRRTRSRDRIVVSAGRDLQRIDRICWN